MSQVLVTGDSRKCISFMTALGLVSDIHSARGQILVGCDPARPDDSETVAGVISANYPTEIVYPFYLEERQCFPGKPRFVDEQGPWPPVPVDPIVVKHRNERIRKAQAKRERKNLKRLKAAGRDKS